MGTGTRRGRRRRHAELLDRLANRLLDAGAEPAGHGSKLARVLRTARATTSSRSADRPGAPRDRRAGRRTAGVGSRGARRRLRTRCTRCG